MTRPTSTQTTPVTTQSCQRISGQVHPHANDDAEEEAEADRAQHLRPDIEIAAWLLRRTFAQHGRRSRGGLLGFDERRCDRLAHLPGEGRLDVCDPLAEFAQRLRGQPSLPVCR